MGMLFGNNKDNDREKAEAIDTLVASIGLTVPGEWWWAKKLPAKPREWLYYAKQSRDWQARNDGVMDRVHANLELRDELLAAIQQGTNALDTFRGIGVDVDVVNDAAYYLNYLSFAGQVVYAGAASVYPAPKGLRKLTPRGWRLLFRRVALIVLPYGSETDENGLVTIDFDTKRKLFSIKNLKEYINTQKSTFRSLTAIHEMSMQWMAEVISTFGQVISLFEGLSETIEDAPASDAGKRMFAMMLGSASGAMELAANRVGVYMMKTGNGLFINTEELMAEGVSARHLAVAMESVLRGDIHPAALADVAHDPKAFAEYAETLDAWGDDSIQAEDLGDLQPYLLRMKDLDLTPPGDSGSQPPREDDDSGGDDVFGGLFND